MPTHDGYREFLRSRWAPRSRRLAVYAVGGNLAFFVFDCLLTRALAAPPSLLALAARRLPWMALPIAGGLAVHRAPSWRGVPAMVIALSVAFTWGNDWVYYDVGLAGSPIRALALVMTIITAATFLPLALPARIGVLALQAAGHVALDWASPQARPAERLWTQVAVLCLVVCVTVAFENVAAGQRRGLRLRRDLERTVAELQESRRRTDESAAALQRLASSVAHDVNNPLAAVKVNVAYLADTDDPIERREVADETLAAVGRIARIVAELRQKAAPDDGDGARGGRGS